LGRRELEDRKVDDVDVTVRFRPISGRRNASGGIIFRARWTELSSSPGPTPSRDNVRLYTMIDRASGT